MFRCTVSECELLTLKEIKFKDLIWENFFNVAKEVEEQRRVFSRAAQEVYDSFKDELGELNYFTSIACNNHSSRYIFEEAGLVFWIECVDAECSARVRRLIQGKIYILNALLFF